MNLENNNVQVQEFSERSIAGKLEGIIGKEKFDILVNNFLYKKVVDGAANNIFSLVYVFNERYVGEMTWGEAWGTRGSAFIGNMLSGGFYKDYNDFMHRVFRVEKEKKGFVNGAKRYFSDVTAFATGQAPLYGLYLIGGSLVGGVIEGFSNWDLVPIVDNFSKINWGKLKDAAIFLALVAPVLGTPQNWTYNFIRRQFGIKEKGKLQVSDEFIHSNEIQLKGLDSPNHSLLNYQMKGGEKNEK